MEAVAVGEVHTLGNIDVWLYCSFQIHMKEEMRVTNMSPKLGNHFILVLKTVIS